MFQDDKPKRQRSINGKRSPLVLDARPTKEDDTHPSPRGRRQDNDNDTGATPTSFVHVRHRAITINALLLLANR
ncbi:hypothetical protein GWI33_016769 [Rhynchophorus ferrugineus]|uniref:Uncharacterized protein n=1 Tax=Rhynchophorus ferrugineus TaxID=354439 RepID=A0A834I161_RHYFE|nr:hypothetical protein GWI33_016769 [Rhynchophorus ferrugineus]